MSVDATTGNEVKFSLKILFDSKAKKVVFAEAKKDFVDFLFHILSLPLTTLVKLLKSEEMTGSLQSLYKSVESLQTECFLLNANCDTVLLPKHLISLPVLSYHHCPATSTHFKCPVHNYESDRIGELCSQKVYSPSYHQIPCGKPMSQEVTFYYAKPSSNGHPGFVKETVAYIVMDNLEVKPMSITLIRSLVTDFDYIVENEVQFGREEGLALLRAILQTSDVLTTIFLGKRQTA